MSAPQARLSCCCKSRLHSTFPVVNDLTLPQSLFIQTCRNVLLLLLNAPVKSTARISLFYISFLLLFSLSSIQRPWYDGEKIENCMLVARFTIRHYWILSHGIEGSDDPLDPIFLGEHHHIKTKLTQYWKIRKHFSFYSVRSKKRAICFLISRFFERTPLRNNQNNGNGSLHTHKNEMNEIFRRLLKKHYEILWIPN